MFFVYTAASLECQRASHDQASCKLIRFTTFGRKSVVNLPVVVGARIETHQRQPQYEIILLTDSGEISLLAHSGGDAQNSGAFVLQLNQFVYLYRGLGNR